MATEGPAVRRVHVAEHPRWGEEMPALWDRLGWLDVEAVGAFGSSRSRQNPWDVTGSLGWDCKKIAPQSLSSLIHYQGVCVLLHPCRSFFPLQKGGTFSAGL